MRIYSRSAWGARHPKDRVSRDPSTFDGVVVHWLGIPSSPKRKSGVPSTLRSVQAYHMDTHGWFDIAYNHAVDLWGRVYELRGYEAQSGANGTTRANRKYAAVVVLMGEGDELTEEAKQSLSQVIRSYQRRGAGAKVFPHGAIVGTGCPGPSVKAWLASEGWKPNPKPKPSRWPKGWSVKARYKWLRWRLGEGEYAQCGPQNPVSRPDVPKRVPKKVWEWAKRFLARRKT